MSDSTVTDRQLAALANGEATMYRGRVIPVIRGGDGTDEPDDLGDIAAEPADLGEEFEELEATAPEPVAGMDWTSPDATEAMTQASRAAFQQILQEAEQQRQQFENQPAPFDFTQIDPLADNFGDQFREGVRQIVQEAIAPLMPVVESSQAREAEQWTAAQLDRMQVPEPDRRDVMFLAGGFEAAAMHSGARVDTPTLLQQANDLLKARDERKGQEAVEKYKADLARKAGAGSEPAGRGGATSVEPAAMTEVEAAKRFTERLRLASTA